jgi:uncharacterized protein YukE
VGFDAAEHTGSGFHASPETIRRFAVILGKQEDHTDEAREYAKAHLTIAHSDEGWITQLLDKHEQVRTRVLTAVEQLKAVCDTNAAAMRETAEYYRDTDEAEVERFDRTLPGSDGRPVPPLTGPFVLTETMSPRGRLTPPPTPDEFADPMGVVNALSNALSPGYWIAEVLDVLIGCNPAEELATRLAGDWEAVAKCGGAFNSLGFFGSDIGVNITHNHRLLLNAWSGKAANGSYDYFTRLAASLEEHKKAFESLRDSYEQVAIGVWRLAKVAGDLVQSIFDHAFWIVVEAAAGGVLSETVAGPAVLWSIAALQCLYIVRTWDRVLTLFDTVQNLVGTARAQVDIVLGAQGGFTAHPLPGSYRHPAVK